MGLGRIPGLAAFPLRHLFSQQIQFHWEVVIDVQLDNDQRGWPGIDGGGGGVVGFFPPPLFAARAVQRWAGGWPGGVSAGHSRRWKGQSVLRERSPGWEKRQGVSCCTFLALSCCNTPCLGFPLPSGGVTALPLLLKAMFVFSPTLSWTPLRDFMSPGVLLNEACKFWGGFSLPSPPRELPDAGSWLLLPLSSAGAVKASSLLAWFAVPKHPPSPPGHHLCLW